MQIFVVYRSFGFRLVEEEDGQITRREATEFDRTFTLDVEENETIDNVLLMLSQKSGVPGTQICLLHQARHLQSQSNKTLADYGIGREATLQWVPRLRGD